MLFHQCSKPHGRTAGTRTSFRSFVLVFALLLIGIHTFGEVFHCKLHGGWAIAVDSAFEGSPRIEFSAPNPLVLAPHEDCGLCALNGMVGILCGASVALVLALVAVAAVRGIYRTQERAIVYFGFPSRAPPVLI